MYVLLKNLPSQVEAPLKKLGVYCFDSFKKQVIGDPHSRGNLPLLPRPRKGASLPSNKNT